MAQTTQLSDSRLSVKGLSFSYEEHLVLDDLTMEVSRGETVALIGRSGSGKSTLLRCLTGLETCKGGEAYLDGMLYISNGKPLNPTGYYRPDITMVFQDFSLFPNLTALQNITLALEKARGASSKKAIETAMSAMHSLGVVELASRYPESLSGGQAQRVAICRALVLDPKIILLDEVTAALDPESTGYVIDALNELRRRTKGGTSIVVATHLLEFAGKFSDTVFFLHEGRILERVASEDFLAGRVCARLKDFCTTVQRFR